MLQAVPYVSGTRHSTMLTSCPHPCWSNAYVPRAVRCLRVHLLIYRQHLCSPTYTAGSAVSTSSLEASALALHSDDPQ